MRLPPTLAVGGKAGPCRGKQQNEACISCILDDSPYLRELSLKVKLALQEHLWLESIPRRTILYAEGDPNEILYILLSGKIKLYKCLSCGRQQIHKLAAIPGDLVACDDLFLDQHFSGAETITDAKLCCIRKSALLHCMEEHHEVLNTLLRTFARNVNNYIRQVANLGPKTATERIACYLIFLHDAHHARNLGIRVLRDSLTRTELADMLGVTQRTLIRGLRQLEARGIISIAHRGFVILDLPALARLAMI